MTDLEKVTKIMETYKMTKTHETNNLISAISDYLQKQDSLRETIHQETIARLSKKIQELESINAEWKKLCFEFLHPKSPAFFSSIDFPLGFDFAEQYRINKELALSKLSNFYDLQEKNTI